MSIRSIVGLMLIAFWAGTFMMGLAQEASVPNKVNINKTLSLRVMPRQLKLERPSGSALKVGNGSTVIFKNGSLSGVISSEHGGEHASIKLVPSASLGEVSKTTIRPIEMRIFDRNIYLDRPVELFVVQDILGHNVMTVINSHKITLGNLRSGVYVVRVQDKGATHTSKFVLR